MKKIKFFKDSKKENKIGILRKTRFKTIASFIFFVFSSFSGAVNITALSAYAEALPDLPLEFDPDITFADNVISFMAASGAATTNIDVLNDIYTNFSGSGYGVADLAAMYDVIDINTGVSIGMSQAEIFSHLGDELYFAENGYDLKLNDYQAWKDKLDNSQSLSTYGAELIHEATLHDSINPWEWDYAEILKTYLKRGDIPFSFDIAQKDIGTTITKTMVDVMNSVTSFYSECIANGLSITSKGSINPDYIFVGGSIGHSYVPSSIYSDYTYYLDMDLVGYYYTDSQGLKNVFAVNNTNSSVNYKRVDNRSGRLTSSSVGANSYKIMTSQTPSDAVVEGFINVSEAEFNNIIASLANGSYIRPDPLKESPDLINPNFSNLDGEDLERMSPSIEQGQALRPMREGAYTGFAQSANGNTESGNAHNNGTLLSNFLDPYIDSPNVPVPTVVPQPTLRPQFPEQPDYPEEPDLTDEEINESLLGVTPDLTNIFPFCIPWDIMAIFQNFTADRKAPRIEYPFVSELFGIDETIVIDLEPFDEAAALVRFLELILFIVGLAVATRYLIGSS